MESKRAKTARGRRMLAKREPKLVENPKRVLVLRGQKTSAVVNDVLTDIFMLKKVRPSLASQHNRCSCAQHTNKRFDPLAQTVLDALIRV